MSCQVSGEEVHNLTKFIDHMRGGILVSPKFKLKNMGGCQQNIHGRNEERKKQGAEGKKKKLRKEEKSIIKE